jgi:hypothetical protein
MKEYTELGVPLGRSNVNSDLSSRLDALSTAVENHSSSHGALAAELVAAQLDDVGLWISYFRAASDSNAAFELLDGVQAAALECVAYSYLGLGRAAITAMRQQIELLLAYTYFKDHPVEWDYVRRTGDGFAMFSFVEKYHKDKDSQLSNRLGMIDHRVPHRLKDIYRLLSAHVHGQSPYTVPRGSDLSSIVFRRELILELPELQLQSTASLSNFLVAVYAGVWPELPKKLVSNVSSFLSPVERRLFFAQG